MAWRYTNSRKVTSKDEVMKWFEGAFVSHDVNVTFHVIGMQTSSEFRDKKGLAHAILKDFVKNERVRKYAAKPRAL